MSEVQSLLPAVEASLQAITKTSGSGVFVFDLDHLNNTKTRQNTLHTTPSDKVFASLRANTRETTEKPSVNLGLFETAQRELITRRGGGLGPSLPTATHLSGTGKSLYGILAGDMLENFMGLNLIPELIDPDASGTGLEKLLGDGKLSDANTNNPPHWINLLTAVNTNNREYDKVVGYYRFSDVFYTYEEGFTCCSLTPGTRLTVTDLSAYNTNSNEVIAR